MRIKIQTFRGRVPRVAPRLLVDGAAQVALNPRLLSGNLEAWQDNQLQFSLAKKGSPYTDVIRTIFPMAIDDDAGPYWLHWTNSELDTGADEVDVAKSLIVGDSDERIYLTGLGRPRWTNRNYATNIAQEPALDPVPIIGAYPYRTFPLGLAGPDQAPDVRVESADEEPSGDSITLTNPGAEQPPATGWVTDLGLLGRCYSNGITDPADGSTEGEIAAYAGTHYFTAGGTESKTTAYQDIDIETAGLATGQSVTLTYRSASGSNNGRARIVMSFLDDGAPNGTAPASPPGPSSTWVLGQTTMQIPANTTHIRLVMAFGNGGTAGVDVNDGYIDDIKLTATAFSYGSDGSDLVDWELSPQETVGAIKRVYVADSTSSDYNKVFRMEGNNTVAWMRKDFGLENAGSFKLEFDVRRSQRSNPFIVIGSNRNGAGEGISYHDYGFGDNGDKSRIEKHSFTGVDGSGLYVEALSSYFQINPSEAAAYWLHFTVTGTYTDEGVWSIKLLVTDNAENPLTIADTTFEVTEFGGWIQLKSKGLDGGSISYTDYDNVNLAITSSRVQPPSGSGGGSTGATSATSYVYTFVNIEGEESAQSPVSETLVRQIGRSVIVTTATTSPADFEAVSKRIYRAVTGTTGSTYLLVNTEGDVPLAQADYVDQKKDSELGEELSSQDFDAPPADGRGIIATANGITWMFSGNQLCPSEQNRPYAYPVAYRLPTDYPIVAIGAIDTDVVVATQSHPYIVVGSTPDALTMAKLEKPQGCVSKRSMVSIAGIGVVYASPDGLTAVSRGSVQVITEGLVSRKEWQALAPETIHAVEHDGRYIAFYNNTAGFIIDPASGGFGWIDLDFYASAAFSNPIDDKLYLVINGDLYAWDSAATKRAYTWKSKQFKLPRPANFAAADIRVTGSGARTLTMYADGSGSPFYTRSITASGEFVLPDASVCKDFLEVQIAGTGTVESIAIAESMEELKQP